MATYTVSEATRRDLEALIRGAPKTGGAGGSADPVAVAWFNTSGMVSAEDQYLGAGRKTVQRLGLTNYRDSASESAWLANPDQFWLAGPTLTDGYNPTYPHLIVGAGTPLYGSTDLTPTAHVLAKSYRLADNWENSYAQNGTLGGSEWSIHLEKMAAAGGIATGYTLYGRLGAGQAPFISGTWRTSPSGADEYQNLTTVGNLWATVGEVRATTRFAVGGSGASSPGASASAFGLVFIGGILVSGSGTLTAGGGSASPIAGGSAGAVLYTDGSVLQAMSDTRSQGGMLQVRVSTGRWAGLSESSH